LQRVLSGLSGNWGDAAPTICKADLIANAGICFWRHEIITPVIFFPENQIEKLSRLLAECGSGTDISRVLTDCKLKDNSGESTKWRRIYWVFLDSQNQYNSANHILGFIQSFLSPVRFVGRSEEFEVHRQHLNAILAFSGLEYAKDGEFKRCNTARTLDEAEKRLNTIHNKFKGRLLHTEVLKYCKVELLQDNYFHAVFEAMKGLAQRIREMSGVDLDGAALVDKVFSV